MDDGFEIFWNHGSSGTKLTVRPTIHFRIKTRHSRARPDRLSIYASTALEGFLPSAPGAIHSGVPATLKRPPMSAEADTLAQEIEQSLELLRRRL